MHLRCASSASAAVRFSPNLCQVHFERPIYAAESSQVASALFNQSARARTQNLHTHVNSQVSFVAQSFTMTTKENVDTDESPIHIIVIIIIIKKLTIHLLIKRNSFFFFSLVPAFIVGHHCRRRHTP